MKLRVGFSTATLVLALAEIARADSPNAQAAEGLFQEGISLLNAGKTSEACAKFAESYRLDPANGTFQNVAACHEKEGKLATAWSEWLELAGKAARADQHDREQLARKRAAELSKDLPHLELRFPASSNVADVQIDGQTVSKPAWSTPLPLDPGTHAVAFSAPRKRTITVPIKVDVGRTTSLSVPDLEDEGMAKPPPAPDTPHTIETPPERGSSGTRRTFGYIVGGAGIVATGVGAYFGIHAIALKGDEHCDGRNCPTQSDVNTRNDAKDAAFISTVAIGAGVAAMAAGTYLVLTSEPRTPTAARMRVRVGLGGVDVVGAW